MRSMITGSKIMTKESGIFNGKSRKRELKSLKEPTEG